MRPQNCIKRLTSKSFCHLIVYVLIGRELNAKYARCNSHLTLHKYKQGKTTDTEAYENSIMNVFSVQCESVKEEVS